MIFNFTNEVNASLKRMSSKYIWWKNASEVINEPERIIAQVMNIGDYDDVLFLSKLIGEEALRKTILNAEAGQFNERSWTYWHYKLGLANMDDVPALPCRRFS